MFNAYSSPFPRKIEKAVRGFIGNAENYMKTPGKILLWVFAVLTVFFLFFAVRFNGLSEIDSLDYAQIARHLSRGDGFTTSFIRPCALPVNPSIVHQPEFTSPPLYIIILAVMFKLFSAGDRTVCLTSGLFYLLSIPLLFFLAGKFFNLCVAFLSVVLFSTNAVILDYSISGLQMPFLIFLFMLFLYTVYSLDEKSVLKTAVSGAVLGLCFLTQYSYGLLYFAVIIYFARYFVDLKRKIWHTAYFTGAFLVVTSPWLCRNLALTGNPFYTIEFIKPLLYSNAFPGHSLLRAVYNADFSIRYVAVSLTKKFYYGVMGQYQQFLSLTQNLLMPFFLISLFFSCQKRKTQLLRKFVYWAGAIFFAVLFIYYPGVNLLIPFIPFIIMASADMFYSVVDNGSLAGTERQRRIILIIFVAVNLYPLGARFIGGARPAANPKERMDVVQKLVGEKETVVTDIPWAVAWYCDRTAIWLPFTSRDYADVKRFAGGLNNLYLSPLILEYQQEHIRIWQSIYLTLQIPQTISLDKGLRLKEGGLFLSDTQKGDLIGVKGAKKEK